MDSIGSKTTTTQTPTEIDDIATITDACVAQLTRHDNRVWHGVIVNLIAFYIAGYSRASHERALQMLLRAARALIPEIERHARANTPRS